MSTLSHFDTWVLREAERLLTELESESIAEGVRIILKQRGSPFAPPRTFDQQLARFAEYCEARKAFEAEAAHCQHEAGVLEKLLVEQCALNGTQSIKRNGKAFYLVHEKSVTVIPEQRAAAVEAARKLGLDDMIVLQPARFGSYAREMLNDTGALPEEFNGLTKVFEQTRMRVRAS